MCRSPIETKTGETEKRPCYILTKTMWQGQNNVIGHGCHRDMLLL